jgi:hypothetical protein
MQTSTHVTPFVFQTSIWLFGTTLASPSRYRPAFSPPVQVKERAREFLARKYRSRALSEEDILHCLYSISDNNSYLLFNRDPIDRQAGRGGSCTWNPKLGLCFACVLLCLRPCVLFVCAACVVLCCVCVSDEEGCASFDSTVEL